MRSRRTYLPPSSSTGTPTCSKGRRCRNAFLETSQAEARQASIAVAERRQMLRLSGLSDDAISLLTSEAAITATLRSPRLSRRPSSTSWFLRANGWSRRRRWSSSHDCRPLWVEIAVPASNIRAIRPGAKVEIDGYASPGQVVLVSETTDAATQTILVRAEVPNTGELRPGQTAAVRISFLSSGESAWELPYSALDPTRRQGVGIRGNRRADFVWCLSRCSTRTRTMSWSRARSRTRTKWPSAASPRCEGSCCGLEPVDARAFVAFALSQRLFVALGVLLLIGAGRGCSAQPADRRIS